MSHDNGWKAGDVERVGDDGYWSALIDLAGKHGGHIGAVVVYGANEETAVGRRNFILRAIEDHIGKNSVVREIDMESLAASCGLHKLEAGRLPDQVGGLWSNLMAFGKSVPTATRTLLYRLRGELLVALGAEEQDSVSDLELIEAVRALKAGRMPALEPTDIAVDAFMAYFHESAQRNAGTYRDNVKDGLRAALASLK